MPTLAHSGLQAKQKVTTVALAGNPNSGKTTIFNALTQLRQKVGNYPGVTVEKKMGRMIGAHREAIEILDLPGTYSLAIRSPDEKVARDVILGKMADTPKPDLVVCVVDATNLERNLYLASQIQDLGVPLIINLNMVDELEKEGKEISAEKLSQVLGVPVVPTVGSRNKGIEALKAAIVCGAKPSLSRAWKMPPAMESEIERLSILLCENTNLDRREAFSQALILLSKDDYTNEELPANQDRILDFIRQSRERLGAAGINWRSVAIEARYAWIHKILRDVVKESPRSKVDITDKLDNILTHRLWGWVVFLGLMALMFFSIFSLATYPMDIIDGFFGGVSEFVKNNMPPGDVRDLLTDGVIAGVGAVIIFMPQILILFFFIGFLQDTGYMARAAFIMDRLMTTVGLHGKSFIPLLSSFACAIPGIMATRTIENPKDRLVTILVAPLMSCSARLPVYTVMIATLIPSTSVWEKVGVMFSMYMLGMIGAFTMAWLFKKTLLKSQTPVLIMELPPYRMPSLKSILLHMWERSRIFLRRAGTIIFGLSIILWALMTYPKHETMPPNEALKASFAGMVGQALEPVIKPLGYDWRIGIGLVGSFAAREVFVSTMNIVFNIDAHSDKAEPLRDAFRGATWPDGRPLFTPLVCLSLMVFYVFAMQCMSTIAIVRRETGGWGWPLFQIAYMTGLAYLMSLLVFQGGRFLGLQ